MLSEHFSFKGGSSIVERVFPADSLLFRSAGKEALVCPFEPTDLIDFI